MTDYDFALDLMTPDPSTVKRNKKKINELLDKYGSGEAIRQNADLADSINYDFIHGDELIDEVLAERAKAHISPQLQNPLLQTNQSALIREARDVRRAYHHDEEEDNNNDGDINGTQSTDNEYADTKSDGGNENTNKKGVNNYIPSTGFKDIYYSQTDSNGGIIYKAPDIHEGGYSSRENDLGKETNYGITQNSLDEYIAWKSSIKTGKDFPSNVKDLSNKQAMQILDEMYYHRYGIAKITNLALARNTFDEEMNQGTNAVRDLTLSINEIKGKNISLSNTVSTSLANVVNNLSSQETIKVNDLLTQKRMERYFDSVDRHPRENINNLRGWYNRARSYYSNSKLFEKQYKDKVDYYIKKKYSQYYNGK